MANEIVIKVRLDEDGSLKQVEQSAKKAAKATDDLGKSRNRYNKGEKGVIGATANGTKAFSKMRESMTGSTGLVSAYAVLASNVFAATAAFNAFRRAAQVEQLEKGLIAVGAAAGSNLGDVAEGLRRITGEALSAEQSMRATALATASGFRTDQLQDLARVAKGASLALGRDMGDAFDRLVRGTAKVEPEILDELGIFVRLDDAVTTYATKLGIAESALTQYDRSQAFLNATLEDGLEKYKDLSEVIDPNPYDKLSAALADLQKNVLNFFNNFAGLGDAVAFAARNLGSLAAVGTTLGAAVTSTVAPGLLRMAESSAESAEGLFQVRSEMAKSLVTGKGLPPKFKELADKLEDGSASAKDFGSAQSSLLGKMGATQKQINSLSKELDENGNVSAKAQKEIDKLTNTKADYANRLSGLKDLQTSQTDASIAASRASAMQNASSLNLVAAFKDLGQAHDEDSRKTKEGTKEKKGFGKALANLGPAARAGAGGLKVLGAAFFTVLPYIGLIISGLSILYGVIKEKFFPEDLVKNRLEEAKRSFKQFSEISTSFQQSTAEGTTRLVNQYIAYAGILDQLIGKLREMKELNDKDATDTLVNIRDQEAAAKQRLAALRKERGDILGGRDTGRTVEEEVAGGIGGYREVSASRSQALAQIEAEEATVRASLESLSNQTEQVHVKNRQNNAATFKAITEGFMTQFAVQQELAAEGENASPFNLAMANRQMSELQKIMKEVSNTTELTDAEFAKLVLQVQQLGREPKAIRNVFQQTDEAVAQVNSSVTKLTTSIKKPYQDIEEGLDTVLKLAADLEKGAAGGAPSIANGFRDLREESKEYQLLLQQFNEDISKIQIPKQFINDNDTIVDAAKAYLAEINRIQEALATLKTKVVEAENASKRMVVITKGITGTQEERDMAANAARAARVALLAEEIQSLKTVTGVNGEAIDNTEEIAKKQAEINKLAGQQVNIEESKLQDQIAITAQIEKQNSLKVEQVKNDLRILKIQQSLSGRRSTPAEEFNLKVASAQAAVTAAQQELALVNARAELEEALFILRVGGAVEAGSAEEIVLEKLRAQLEITRQIAEEKLRGANIGVTETITGGITAGTSQGGAQSMRGEGIDTGLQGAIQTGGDNLALAEAQAAAAKSTADDTYVASLSGEATAKEVEIAEQALILAQANVKTAGVNMITGILDSQAEALAKLGPEGEILAAFTTFSSDLLSNMDAFANAGESTAERLESGFTMAASAIGGIGQIMAAQSKQQIGEIDSQIAAEKKRDGKSKESLAKIAGLEKKKEAMEKKAFERNKKMQMAQTIANTAAGIMGVLSGDKDPIFTMPLALAQVGIIAAMGAAQLAVIAGTSFQGGGSAPSAGGGQPSSISMGARNNSVDLSRSQSARGELAYFRGERGTGGPENFRNAFSGYRNRAGGGNTAFMVGEQGPELFVPETPGTIVPNDEVSQAAPTNVNFSISAVDAAGVEDLLIRQQGNIIGMIREAANSYGQDFVETVDTSVFNDTTNGVSRY